MVMQAPAAILAVWARFASVPMETFTKAWWHRRLGGAARQRTPAEMAEHRAQYGAGGNCFDLTVWFLDECRQAGVSARAAGHDLGTERAHIAAVATDEAGDEYLCDLGDQWFQPILVSTGSDRFSPDWQAGFIPAADVRVEREGSLVRIFYRRPNGKQSRQEFDLTPVGEDGLARACHASQNLLRYALCERLIPYPETGVISHWEYDRGRSFWGLDSGLVVEPPCETLEEWVVRISERSGIGREIVRTALEVYGGK